MSGHRKFEESSALAAISRALAAQSQGEQASLFYVYGYVGTLLCRELPPALTSLLVPAPAHAEAGERQAGLARSSSNSTSSGTGVCCASEPCP